MTDHASAPDLAAAKRALRRAAQAAREAAARDAPGAAEAVAARLALLELRGATVSGYLPMRAELDPRPAMEGFAARGARLCLPVAVAKGAPLAFRLWTPGAPTVAGGYGVEIPCDDLPATPDLLLVPLLAFDRSGLRLGYGGGFYDRTLAALRAAGDVTAIGLAFAAQEVAAIPADDADARLDWVVTEREAIRCG